MAGVQGPNQLLDLLRALRRRRYQVLVPALLVATVGIAFAVIVPKRYKVTTRIEINDRTRIETDFRLKNPQETAVRREATAAFEHVVHFERVKEIILGNLDQWPEYRDAKDEFERAQFISRRVLYRNLSAQPTNRDPKNGTIFIDIGYSDEDPVRAANLLDALTKSWLDEMRESDRATLINDRAKLQEILDLQQTDLNEKQERLYGQFALLGQDPTAPAGDTRREDRGDWTFRTLDKLKTELADVELELHTAEVEHEQAARRFQAEPATIQKRIQLDAKDPSSEIGQKKEARDKLEERLAGLLPSHSEYKRLKPKLDELQREIEELERLEPEAAERWEEEANPRRGEYELEARKKEDLVVTLSAKRDELLGLVKNYTNLSKARIEGHKYLDDLNNQVVEAQKQVNETRQQWSDRDKSLQMLDSSPPPWKIAQPPVPTTASATPNPLLVSVISVVLGFGLGGAIALASEYLRSCYRSVGDLAAVMSVPVLGAIDTIVTRRERRKVQLARAIGGLSTATIVGTIAWITWLWHSSPERLPLELQDAIELLRSNLK